MNVHEVNEFFFWLIINITWYDGIDTNQRMQTHWIEGMQSTRRCYFTGNARKQGTSSDRSIKKSAFIV